MNVPSKSIQIRWAGLFSVLAIVAMAFAVSFCAGKDAVKGCMAAITVSGLGGCIALILIAYAAAYRPGHLTILALAAGTVRLLLMLVGSAIILLFTKVNILWFVVWIGVFYLVLLVFEIRVAIGAVNGNKSVGACRF